MKQTDIDRKERELRRARKKAERIEKGGGVDRKPGDYIDELSGMFFHNEVKIYNILNNDEILEFLMDMKEELEEKHWDAVIRKAVKKTKVSEREEAIKELFGLLNSI